MVHPTHHRSLSDAAANEAADILWTAWSTGRPLDALPPTHRPATVADAVAVQVELSRLAGPSAGWKIAGTSPGSRALLGSDGPLAAPLPGRFAHGDGDTVPAASRLGIVEAEIAFVIAADLPRPPADRDLPRAISAAHLALELPDARHRDVTTAGELANLADLALAGRYVLGPAIPSLDDVDLRHQEAHIEVNDQPVASGSGRAVLESPWLALAWLVRELARHDRMLRAGDIVLTGSFTAPPRARPGDRIRADFPGLGAVTTSLARPGVTPDSAAA